MEQSGGGGCLLILLAIFGFMGFVFLTPVGVESDMGMLPTMEASQVSYPVYAAIDIPCGTLITPDHTDVYPTDDINLKYATVMIESGFEITPDLLSDTEPDCSP